MTKSINEVVYPRARTAKTASGPCVIYNIRTSAIYNASSEQAAVITSILQMK